MFFKNKPKEPKEPQIVVKVLDKNFSVYVDWPNIKNKSIEDLNAMAESLYATVVVICGTNMNLFSIVQESIGYTAGFKKDEVFGKMVLGMINNYLLNLGFKYGNAAKENVVTNNNSNDNSEDEPFIDSDEVLEEANDKG